MMKYIRTAVILVVAYSVPPTGLSSAAVPHRSVNVDYLKHSSWFGIVSRKIEAEEYRITASGKNVFTSPNIRQNLLFTYRADGFSVTPLLANLRAGEAGPTRAGSSTRMRKNIHAQRPPEGSHRQDVSRSDNWHVNVSLLSYGRNGSLIRFHAGRLVVHGCKAEAGGHGVGIKYRNTVKGMRQDFVVNRRPEGTGKLRLLLSVRSDLNFKSVKDGLVFFDAGKKTTMKYDGLRITDSHGKVIKGKIVPTGPATAEIQVDDRSADYPLIVDPLSSSAEWSKVGEGPVDEFGTCVATAGDVNGDGYSDILVSAPVYGQNVPYGGKVYLYYGSAAGLDTSASWTASGADTSDYFGCSVSTAGDVNGDGYSDFMVGSYGHGSDSGKVNVYYGSPSGPAATASWTYTGGAYQEFGYSVSTAGDVNGDGYSDVLVGTYSPSSLDTGRVYLFYGSSSGLPATPSWTRVQSVPGDQFGSAVASAGDVNGDGFSDFIVGAQAYSSSRGSVYVFYGSSSGPASTFWEQTGTVADEAFGKHVAGAGDVNGDGYSDIIIGTYPGSVYLFYGNAYGVSSSPSWTHSIPSTSPSVASAGDVNGDGYSDVILGGPSHNSNTGIVRLYYGGPAGLSTSSNWTQNGEDSTDSFGYCVATAGDVNGDGYSDVIIGSASYSTYGATISYGTSTYLIGKAYAYYGGPYGLNTSDSWSAVGENSLDFFGISISTAGDVNGDGYSDVIVGAPYCSSNGKVYAYYGSASGLDTTAAWTVTGENSNDQFGASVAAAGDVNGDGYGDVIVGATGFSSGEGKAYVFRGSASGLSTTASWTATGENAGDQFGTSVATAGDVNGDGYSDVIVGAQTYSSYTGKAYVYHGSAAGLSSLPAWTATGEATYSYFGSSVSTAGDVNGDGFSDVIVGANGYSIGTGRAYVYCGSSAGLAATASWFQTGENSTDHYGFPCATAGDVNGDGYSDVIVGADGYPSGGNTGKVYVYYGGASGLSSSAGWTHTGENTGDYFGYAASTAGDVNGDGYSDILVGAYEFSSGGGTGKAYVFDGSSSGLSSTPVWTHGGENSGDVFGYSVAPSGDVNGDAYSDVLVGARGYSSSGGKAYLFYGDSSGGDRRNIQQYQPSSSTVLGPNAKTTTVGSVRLSGFARSSYGRARGKLVYEYQAVGTPFTGPVSSTGSQNTFTDLGSSGASLNADLNSVPAGSTYRWRVRTEYDQTNNPFQRYGPWRYYTSYQPLTLGSFETGGDFSLAVQAVGFRAEAEAGHVVIGWRTQAEVDNDGFNILKRKQGVTSFSLVSSYVNNDSLKGLGTSSTGRNYSFTDSRVCAGASYEYKIQSVTTGGRTNDLSTLTVTVDAPKRYALYQNYPNPFNPSTKIRFDLKEASSVTLEVYNTLGQRVEDWNYGMMEPGRYEKAINMSGFSSGVYFYRLVAEGTTGRRPVSAKNDNHRFMSVKKFLLLK